MKNLEEVFDWMQISCSQFEGILCYNTKTKVYKHNDVIIEPTDKRIIAYLEHSKNMKPINLWDVK